MKQDSISGTLILPNAILMISAADMSNEFLLSPSSS